MSEPSNIVQFPKDDKEPPELLVGPFQEWRVVVDGRMIPRLTGFRDGENDTALVLDHRFCVIVPNDLARQVAWIVANALAIGEGYSHLGAEQKSKPFAPQAHAFNPGDIP